MSATRFTVRGIDAEVWRELHRQAKERGMTVGAAVTEALRLWLKQQPGTTPEPVSDNAGGEKSWDEFLRQHG